MSTTTENTKQGSVEERHRARVLAQVAALRALCDFAEEHADHFPDHVLARDVNVFVAAPQELTALATAFGGRWDKQIDGGYFSLERDFGGSEYSRVKLVLNAKRENVCERVQVGTETRMVPDPQLVEEIPLVEIQEPVFEWRCPESLLDIRAEDFTGPVSANTSDPGW